jgi:quercetin dioxygenase-like cupin family protein
MFFFCGCAGKATPQVASEAIKAEPVLAMAAASQPAALESGVYNWNELAVQTTKSGQRRQVFISPTATLDQLEVHVTTLNPGEEAHAPHRHPHEEMMLLKEGTLQAMINDKLIPMPTGSILFVAPNDLHVVKNVGTTQATYFVLTWRTPRTGAEGGKAATGG